VIKDSLKKFEEKVEKK